MLECSVKGGRVLMGESYKFLLLFCWTLAEPESCGTGNSRDINIILGTSDSYRDYRVPNSQSSCLSLLNAGNLTWLIPHFGMGEQGEIQN